MPYAYPTSVSLDDWAIVLAALKGQFPDPKVAAHVIWEVAGYGLGSFYSDVKLAAESKAPITPAEKKKVIAAVEAHVNSKDVAATVGAIPWGTLFQLLMTLLAMFGKTPA